MRKNPQKDTFLKAKAQAGRSGEKPQQHNDFSRDYLNFEKLISNLSARFVNIPPDQVDVEIEVALKLILDFFQVDRCGLLGFSSDRKRVHVTHAAYAEDVEQVSGDIDLAALFPWSYEKLVVEGQPVCLERIEELPETAQKDKANYIAMNMRSLLNIPLFFEGRVSSIIVINDMHAERRWPEIFIPRLRLLGEIFINAVERRDADRALRESEARLNLATDAAGVMPWTLDMDSGRIWTTEKGKEFFGFAPESERDLHGFLKIVHPEDRENLRRTVELTLQSGKDDRVEYRIIRPDGSIRWVLSVGRPYPASLGRGVGLMGLSADISERKTMEENLRASEEKFRGFFNNTPDYCYIISPEGTILNINGSALQALGYGKEELVGKPLTMIYASESVPKMRDLFSRWKEKGQLINEEMTIITKSGERRTVLLNVGSVRGKDGTMLHSTSIQNDITSRKRAEEELRKAYEEIRSLKEKLELENIILQEEVKQLSDQTEIVGQSASIKRVLQEAAQVAKTDTSVLILGETGTGKGLLAQAIHNMSARKNRPMVSVNCAALPPTLIESELFGREKGAFTGALTKMAGRFEVADGSTIFLDEIGELPLELQAKMLRVIEEGKFERLGSTKSLHVDVRLIAATNRDLADEVEKGRFRSDLFYRLNVFPIVIPPLRERREDIPLLVWGFVTEFQQKMGKRIDNIPKKTMDALQSYEWPGNGRELRNIIERAMIVSSGRTLEVSLLETGDVAPSEGGGLNLEDVERRHVISVLKRTSWQVTGKGGAAEILGLKGTTLQSKMKKLGIRRPQS